MSDGSLKGKKPRPTGSSGSSGSSGGGQMGGRKTPPPPAPRPAPPRATPAAPPPKPKPATPPPPRAKPATPPPATSRPVTPRPVTPATPGGVSPLRGQAARERLAQRANTAVRPLPAPPVRRPIGGQMGGLPPAQTQNPQLQAQIQGVFDRFAQLESEAQLSDVYEAIGQIDTRLTQLPLALDGLRQRGYVHGGRLEEQIAAFDQQWDNVRPRVEDSLQDHVQRLNSDMDQAEQHINRLSAGPGTAGVAGLSAAEASVNALDQKVNAARSGLRGLFGNLESELGQIDYSIGRIEWMLDQFDASQEVRLRETEGPLAAVEAEWFQDGDEGPNGILFLTDQRLLFEQKEEVAVKKFLGIFKTDSETLQRLLLDVPIHEIEKVEHGEEGGFLGMGKKDMLDLILSSNQPVSRARFHLQGQESADWATTIKQVQTGEINRDRDEDYVAALEEAQAATATFPTQCPNCFAAVPTPPRGAPSVVCEFCGTVIMPAAD